MKITGWVRQIAMSAPWDEVRGGGGVEKWPMEKPGDNPVSTGLGEVRAGYRESQERHHHLIMVDPQR